MYCGFCGAKNDDNNSYCKKCGKKLEQSAPNSTADSMSPSREETKQNEKHWQTPPDLSCPRCKGCNCQLYTNTTVKTSGGYSLSSGCFGTILLGPIGLLCGGCGRTKTSVRSEQWFLCNDCGKEFISKKSALLRTEAEIVSSSLYSAVFVLFLSYAAAASQSVWWTLLLIALILGTWAAIPVSLCESTGKELKELLQDKDYKRMVGGYVAGIVVGIVAGIILYRWIFL